jgi:ankyrin repeat protein
MLFFLCFAIFAAPLFGQSREELTDDLRKAIADGDSRSIAPAKSLLERGADPNGIFSDRDKKTFLMQAVSGYNRYIGVELAGLLLDYGANLKARDSHERTAAFYCNAEGAALLASRGIRFDVTDEDGTSPLLWLYNSQYQKALLILEWEEQHSPDFSAHFENRKEYLTPVLNNFMNFINLGSTPVQTATTLIEKLLDGGADITAIRYFHFLALEREAQFIISSLLEHGVPIDTFDRNGKTLLYTAAYRKNVGLARFLLEKGASPNRQLQSGETALMVACSSYSSDATKSLEMVGLLLQSGADPNIADNEGETALMKVRGIEVARLLLSGGADPSIGTDSSGRNVLYKWLSFLDRPLLEDLFEKGVDSNFRDANGITAFHHYMLNIEFDKGDYESIVAAFLAAGARPAEADDKGHSALSVAIRLSRNHEEMVPLLDMMKQYANDDEIRLAESKASRVITERRREKAQEVGENIGHFMYYYFPVILGALSIPLAVGGLSIGMRERVYKDNLSQNWMGSVNGALNITMAGMASGFLLLMPLATHSSGSWGDMFSGLFPIVGSIIGGVAGLVAGMILAALVPSIGRITNDYPALYYIPTAASVLAATGIIIFRF